LSILLVPSFANARRVAVPPPLEICFVPLGKQDSQLLAIAQRGAAYLYGAETRLLPAKALTKKAYYKPRKRYRGEKLLDFLDEAAKSLPAGARCDVMVGITTVDISTTKGKHKDWGILGLGSIGGRSAVVSSFRMKKRVTRRTQKRRMVSTVNHEIGHVLSAPHGGAPGCLMNDAQGTVKTIDKEDGLLCAESRALIEAHSGRRLPRITSFDWAALLDR
jgi:archaemetzincin